MTINIIRNLSKEKKEELARVLARCDHLKLNKWAALDYLVDLGFPFEEESEAAALTVQKWWSLQKLARKQLHFQDWTPLQEVIRPPTPATLQIEYKNKSENP